MADLNFETQDAVPEDLRAEAKQVDGKFIVSVVPKSKLDEFRNNNINLSKERDSLSALKTKFISLIGSEDLDAFGTELATLRDTEKKVKDGKLVEDKGLEAAINERTAEMKKAYEDQLRESGTKIQSFTQAAKTFELKFKNLLVDQAVQSALMTGKTGLREDALPVVLKEARDIFRVTDEDKVVPYQGDVVVYGSDGTTPMTPTEWLKKLGDAMPFLLKDSTGGGAGGQPSRGGNGVDTSKMSPMQKMSLGRRA